MTYPWNVCRMDDAAAQSVRAAAAGFTFINSKSVAGANGGTTVAFDSTGTTLFAAVVSSFGAVPVTTVTDNKGNTFNPRAISGTSGFCQIFDCFPTTVGAGHTFTISVTGSFSSLAIMAFGGGTNATPFDLQAGSSATSASASSGGITPSVGNEVVVIGVSTDASTIDSIDSGFTIAQTINFSAGNNFGVSAAYLIQGSSPALANPTFTLGGSNTWGCRIACYKVS